MAARNPGGEKRAFCALLAPRVSRSHFFLAVFFRVTHDGPNGKGTTRNLNFALPLLFYVCNMYKKNLKG